MLADPQVGLEPHALVQVVLSDAIGDRVPTKKGLTLPPAKLPELRDLVDKAIDKGRVAGLIGED